MRKLPSQPIHIGADGVRRFVPNRIVCDLLDAATKAGVMDMTEIAKRAMGWSHGTRYTNEERAQFAELLGYSVDAYADLSYVTNARYKASGAAIDVTPEAKAKGGGDGEA